MMLKVAVPWALGAAHPHQVGDLTGKPVSGLPGISWHEESGLLVQAGGMWMPKAPEPTKGFPEQAPAGRLENQLSGEQSEQEEQQESPGRGAEGPDGGSERWPRST